MSGGESPRDKKVEGKEIKISPRVAKRREQFYIPLRKPARKELSRRFLKNFDGSKLFLGPDNKSFVTNSLSSYPHKPRQH